MLINCIFYFVVPALLIPQITEASHHLYMVEEHIVDNVGSDHNKAILQLSERLLTMSSYGDLCDVFMLIDIKIRDHRSYHFFESGDYIGYLLNSSAFPQADSYYRIYTPEDILVHRQQKKDTCKFLKFEYIYL